MAFPLGDILRAFVKSGPLRKILDALKGTKITTPGGTDILLDEKPGAFGAGRSPFDSTPHQPGPVIKLGPQR